MAMNEFRLRMHLILGRETSGRHLDKNFRLCPHCQKKGKPALVESLNENGPVISRSDGETFHLVLGDRPIEYPTEKSSGKADTLTAGFWYMKERGDGSEALTETVVVMFYKGGASWPGKVERIADRLADKLAACECIETFYEFDGVRLQRLA